MNLLVTLLLAAATMKGADGDYARLFDEPCTTTAGVFATMPEELRPMFKAAEVMFKGKLYAACYLPGEQVYFIDEEGDEYYINNDAFVPDVSA